MIVFVLTVPLEQPAKALPRARNLRSATKRPLGCPDETQQSFWALTTIITAATPNNVKGTINLRSELYIFWFSAGLFSVFFLPIPSGFKGASRSNKEDQGKKFVTYRSPSSVNLRLRSDSTLIYILCSCHCQTSAGVTALFWFESV